jgi:vacuolar-type H+-ATPase subunit F/Vma7
MAAHASFKDRNLIAVIGDEVQTSSISTLHCSLPTQDSITGLLLAGIGHIDEHQKKNFLIVDSSQPDRASTLSTNSSKETQISTIEAAFQEFTERKDVAILLINQHVRTLPFSSSVPSIRLALMAMYINASRLQRRSGRPSSDTSKLSQHS